MNRNPSFAAGFFVASLLFAVAAISAAQSPPAAKSATAMARTEHEWKGAGRSSTFDVLWIGGEMKMIREEMAAVDGMNEKNEYVFNAGKLLHYKQDRYPEPGRRGDTVATMVSFDKSGKPSISLKRIDGKPAGPVAAEEIARARKHLEELLRIAGKPQR